MIEIQMTNIIESAIVKLPTTHCETVATRLFYELGMEEHKMHCKSAMEKKGVLKIEGKKIGKTKTIHMIMLMKRKSSELFVHPKK